MVSPSAAAAISAPDIERLHRSRASRLTDPSALVRASRSAVSPAGSTMRAAGTAAAQATTPEARNMIHMWWAPTIDPMSGPTAMPAISALKMDANARPRRSTATVPDTMASEATAAPPAPRPCIPRSRMAVAGSMGSRKAKLAAAYTARPASSTGLRPMRSASLPTGYWKSTPAAKNEAMTRPASVSVPPRWRM